MKVRTKVRLKRRAKNFLLELLEFIKDVSEFIPEPLEGKYQYQRRIRRHFLGYPPQKINQGLYELKRKGLIERKLLKNNLIYDLTISGEQKVLMSKINRNKYNPKDGTSCIVIFDIPEEKSRHRRFLRRFLMQNGYMNLQKSVLIGPSFVPIEFYRLLELLKIRQNVTVIKGKILYL